MMRDSVRYFCLKITLDESFLYFERLAVFKKSLALIVFGIGGVLTRESDTCHIWVMEYGVVRSWTK